MYLISITALGFFFILTLLLYYKIRYPFVKRMNEIAGPDGLPFFGMVNVFYSWPRNKRAENFRELFLQYGPLFRTWIGPECLFHIGSAEHAQKILSSRVNVGKSLQYSFARPFLGKSIGIIPNEKWFERRRLLTPAFHAIVHGNYFDTMVQNCEIFLRRLEKEADSDEFDIFPYITDLSIDIIAETSLNVKLNVQKGLCADYAKHIDIFSHLLFKRMINPFIYLDFIYALTQDYRENKKSTNELHKISMTVVNQRIADRKKENSFLECVADESKEEIHSVSDRKKNKTFLDTLLDASDVLNNALTLEDIREEVDNLIFAGYDPAALIIAMAIYLIGLYPKVQDNIHAELDSILPFEDSPLNAHTLGELKYLESTVKEAFRIFTPVPIIARCLAEPVVLDNHTLPVSTNVVIHMHAIHRSPTIYPNPDQFDPSNFFSDREKDRHPLAFIPFSAGPRNCLGQQLAKMEIKITLATFFKKYKVTSVTPLEDMTMFAELVLKPEKGVIVKLKRRTI